ncbi:hypothetical protein LCGC14_1758580 [marine sediment metagenome]|uniref:Uncharacterized protein n=1 Tax=marine sediment metagenome TaxID=412755 RepID=A0A0F9HP16_9ZZZZ
MDMITEKERNYYLKKKRILMRTFDMVLNIGKQILIDYFGESKFKEISITMRNDFEALIPQIPFVGGKDSRFTDTIINATSLLPLLRAFEKEGLGYYEIGKLTYNLFEAIFKVIPPTDDIFTEEYLNNEKARAKNSKLRKYPGDWVFDFVEGDGKTFSYGIDYSECGVHKFYKNQDAEHFMPIACIADYAQAQIY